MLSEFWGPFQSTVASMTPVRQREVFDMLDQVLAPCFFPTGALPSSHQSRAIELLSSGNDNSSGGGDGDSGSTLFASATALLERPANISVSEVSDEFSSERRTMDPRACPLCQTGRLVIKPSSSGGFIGCTNFSSTVQPSGCGYARPLLAAQREFWGWP